MSKIPFRRSLVGLAAAALTVPVGLVAASPAAAATPQIRDISRFACNPSSVPDAAFADVQSGSTFDATIRCLAGYGITQGFTDGTYRPTQPVIRADMALFVYRLGQMSGATFDTSPAGFTDIGNLPQPQQDAINALAHKLVVKGETSTRYVPGGQVTRGQMAAFLNRLEAKVIGTSGFPVSGTYFSDIAGSVFADDINAIASVGITGGINGTQYAPDASVTRDQMAAFLTRDVDANVDFGQLPSKFPAGNESFTAKPSAEQAQDFSKQTTYTVGVDRAATVSIALLPAGQVSRDGSTGAVTFSSTTPIASGGSASIESVNGTATGATAGGSSAKTQVDGVKPSNGQVTFAVNATALNDIVPVVWADLPAASSNKADTKLDTAPGGFATEPFVAAGQVDYVPAQAATSASAASVTVVSDPDAVNPRIGYFVATSGGLGPIGQTTATYYFNGPNDKFGYQGDPGKLPSRSAFQSLLTPGDVVQVTYSQDPSKGSVFNVTTDTVPPASNVQATAGDFGGGPAKTDVQLTWTASPQADAVYDIYRDANGNGTADSGELAKQGATGASVTLFGQPTGTYDYLVVARGGVSGSTSSAAASNNVTLPVPLPQTLANGAVLQVDNPFTGKADNGDQWTLYFNQPVQVGSSPQIQVTDSAGKTGLITNSVASFKVDPQASGLSAAGEILHVTLLKPALASDGSATLSYPLTITGATGITDAAGNNWDVAHSGDKAIDAGAYLFQDDAHVGDSTFTIVWNQPMSDDAGTAQSYTYSKGLVQSAVLQADHRSVVITISGSMAKGDTIGVNPLSPPHDAGGAAAPSQTYTLNG